MQKCVVQKYVSYVRYSSILNADMMFIQAPYTSTIY